MITQFNKEKKQNSNQTQWVSVVPKRETFEKQIVSSLKVTIGKATIEVTPGFD